jgi:hypothetical protein
LVAIAVAIPAWLALDDDGGDGRRPAALEEQVMDCRSTRDPEACAELDRLLATLREDLGVLDERLRAAEATLASSDDSQLANVDLQNLLQEQQEAMLTMASISVELSEELGDDAQLANVDLQNILQKQQQTVQMMSNISKMLFDTAQSVIRKMGG